MDLNSAILGRSVEDYTGLWELLGEAEGVIPSATREELRSAALSSLALLLDRGWIAVYRGVRFDGDQKELAASERDLLSELKYWDTPTGRSDELRIGATTAGEAAYYAGTMK